MKATPEKTARPVPMPKTLGACADLVYDLRQQRLAAQKVVEEIEAREKAVKEHLIQQLPKSEAGGVTGKHARVTIVKKQVAQVKDWDLFYRYVLKTKDFSLLQRRVGEAAVQERWDAGKPVPGVEPFVVVTLSIGKA